MSIWFVNTNLTYGKFTIEEIRREYKGEIIDIYSSRKNVTPTFLEIKTKNDIIDVSVNNNVIDYSSIGDSIFKIKNENIITVKNKMMEEKSFYLFQISEKLRNHRNFPKEWKKKWMVPLNN